jgi:hypothetical protein
MAVSVPGAGAAIRIGGKDPVSLAEANPCLCREYRDGWRFL